MWLPHSFIVLLFAVLASGSITNTTIDDSSSSFTFSGSGGWIAITPTSPCNGCASKPDASQIHGGTWHDGNCRNGAPSATTGSFTFKGSAVYIFGIDQTTTQPDIAFSLGSVQQVHRYTGTERYVYNALFFSADGLAADQTHTVNWIFNVAPNTGVGVQAALFDYAIVTSGEEDVKVTTTPVAVGLTPTQPSTPSNTNDDNKATSSTNSNSSSSTVSRSQIVSTSGNSRSKSGASQTGSATSQFNPTPSPANQASSGSTVTMSQMTTVTAQSASSHSKSNIGIIVGSIVGGLVVVILAIFAWLYSRRVRHVSPENEPARGSQFLRIEDYPVQHALYTREVGAPVSVPTTGSNRHTGLAGPSAVSLLTPSDGSSAAIPTVSASSGPAPEVQPPVPINTRSRDSGLRLMEERLAVLEAQVAVQQEPPPYVHEDDD